MGRAVSLQIHIHLTQVRTLVEMGSLQILLNDLKMTYLGLSVWVLCPMTGIHAGTEETWRSHMMEEAETGVTQPEARDAWNSSSWERQKGHSHGASRECRPATPQSQISASRLEG